MVNRVIEEAKKQKNFYRDNYRKVIITLFFILVIILCLLVAIGLVVLTHKEPKYYSTANNGNLRELTAVPRGTGLPDVEQ